MTFLKNIEPNNCTIIYHISDIANCDDFDIPELILIYNNNNNLHLSYNNYVSIDNNVLPYDNGILSIQSIIRSLTFIEHKEDVNDYTDPIIVKPIRIYSQF